jgi:1-deoxy-D-xylulose-5-phosphate reductoisomerase
MMNKGLEVIEAHWLFDCEADEIDVIIHPQSVVHSMVEFTDGSTIAQASPPDMRIPIALGMAWPERIPEAAPGCDWSRAATWEFFPLDEEAFPAVSLARRAGAAGGTAPAVFNGADEACVEAFLAGRLAFDGIVTTVAAVLDEHLGSGDHAARSARDAAGSAHVSGNDVTLESVIASDGWARVRALELAKGSA